jgi:hypothetical protein
LLKIALRTGIRPFLKTKENSKMKNGNATPNIIVFTMHKSASMYIHQLSGLLCELSGLPYHSPNSSPDLGARRLLLDKEIWRTRHGCFAPIRFYVEVPNIEEYQVILHLRDPRDVLVSMYFSYCHIHHGEIAGNTGYRKEVAERGIDEFVLNKASPLGIQLKGDYGTGGHVEDLIGDLKKRYEDYIDRLIGRPNVTLLKYEQMVTDYRGWLTKFSKPFPLKNREAIIEKLVAQSSTIFPKRDQDVMTHVRHVTPGDHIEKLKPSTIKELDTLFADILETLDYPKSSQ